jgi:hypothetical protein
MSTKPKGIVCYSADELNHFYIKGDDQARGQCAANENATKSGVHDHEHRDEGIIQN